MFSFIIALLGVIGALKLPLFTGENAGPGFVPLLCSLVLGACGVFLFFKDKSKEKLNIRAWLAQGDKSKALVFFLFNICLLIFLYLFGSFIAMLAFCILACIGLKRQTRRSIVLFSVGYTIIIYVSFVVLLKMPFDRGIIFEMLRY